ncbi:MULTISPECIES: tape measure protein [Serratia]|uniref:tape measure protein n=1 Tax=Serratia TaxID=613 RepID=UPI003D2DE4A9
MASGNGNLELRLRIQADLKSAQASLKQLQSSLDSASQSGTRLGSAGGSAASGLDRVGGAADSANRKLDKTAANVDGLSNQLTRLKPLAAAIGIALGGGLIANLASTSDEYTNLAARIRLVSTSNEQAATTFKSVIGVANETGQRIASTAELYTRMARSLKGSATQTELLQVTSTINKAAIVSGATAEESTNAIIQLSQGLASGTLRGEEFNSVSEQMPRIMEMLEKSLGKTRGELRAMAEQGMLTTQVVFKALKDGAGDVDREFAQMPLTIGRAATEMANAWVEFVGGTNDALGASKAIAAVISGLASNMSTLTTAAIALAVVMGGRKVAALVAATTAARADRIETLQLAEAEYAEAKAAVAAAQAQAARAKVSGITAPGARAKAEDLVTASLVRQTAAEKALGVARASASTFGRLGTGLMGLLGGPMGLAITGVTLAVGGLSAAYAANQEHEAALAQQHQQTIQTLEDQRQKTEALINAQGRLKDSVSTGDALTQQRTNADVLTQDSKKLSDLQSQAASLKQQIDGLLSSPAPSGIGIVYLTDKLAEVQKQIDALTPKFDNLSDVQGKLSDELENRLARAMDAPTASGKTLRDVLTDLQNAGPIRWMDEAVAQMAQSEESFTALSAEADKLRPKLEKELADATYTAAQQLEQLRDKTIAAALAAGKAPEDIDKLRESLEKLVNLQKQTDQAKENKKNSDAAARSAKSAASANETYVKGLEKQAFAVGKTKSQVAAYELAEKSLSGALKARAEAALAVIAAGEQKEKSDANATKNAQLQAQYLKATGDVLGGGLAEVRANIAEMRKEFTQTGNTEGLAWLDKLLPVQEAKVRADALKKSLDDLQTYRSQKESSIQAQVQAGLISELQGRRQLVALHQEVGSKITESLPQLREMAALPGEAGEQMRDLLANLENELITLKSTTDDLTAAFKDGLQDGMESTLNGLADGTLNLSDAVLNLAKSVANAMAQVASRNLAGMAMEGLGSVTDSLKGLLGLGASTAGSAAGTAVNAATDTATDAAGATTYATAITTASTAGATAMGTSITAGSTALTGGFTTALTTGITALTTALTTAFTTGAATLASAIASASAAGSASSGLGAAASVAAATGGQVTGPGTGTSDSIAARLSNGEFVMKTAAVQRYGVDFMHAVNQGRLGAFADGGLVSDPGFSRAAGVNQSVNPDAPGAQGAGGGTTNLQQYLVLDPNEMLDRAVKSAPGNRVMMTWVKANTATLKQLLGGK